MLFNQKEQIMQRRKLFGVLAGTMLAPLIAAFQPSKAFAAKEDADWGEIPVSLVRYLRKYIRQLEYDPRETIHVGRKHYLWLAKIVVCTAEKSKRQR